MRTMPEINLRNTRHNLAAASEKNVQLQLISWKWPAPAPALVQDRPSDSTSVEPGRFAGNGFCRLCCPLGYSMRASLFGQSEAVLIQQSMFGAAQSRRSRPGFSPRDGPVGQALGNARLKPRWRKSSQWRQGSAYTSSSLDPCLVSLRGKRGTDITLRTLEAHSLTDAFDLG